MELQMHNESNLAMVMVVVVVVKSVAMWFVSKDLQIHLAKKGKRAR
jgi:hypothetical protein